MRKSVEIQVKCTEQEKADIKEMAFNRGCFNVAMYIRKLIEADKLDYEINSNNNGKNKS